MTGPAAGGVTLVVGAASGIGRAVTRHLAETGVRVVAADRDADGLASLAAGTASLDTRVVDVLDDAAVRALVAGVDAPLNALVNTVGINPDAGTPSHLVDLDVFEHVLRVNLRAALSITQAVLPRMLDAGYGRVVHLASVAGKEGNPQMASYSASKAGLIGLVKVLGREYATTGVTVNAVAPAVIVTPMVDATPPDVVAAMLSRIPMGRFGELDEVSAMVAFVASPACSFTTGATFDLSGGRATY